MTDFLCTREPLIKTSNYHKSVILFLNQMSGSTEKVKGPLTGREESLIGAKNLSCTLNDRDLK